MVKLSPWILAFGIAVLSSPASASGMLQAFESNSLQQIMQQQKGKPFMLFIWSLDCTYCQITLDVLAQAQREDKGLTIVTLSTDSVTDAQAVSQMEKRLTGLNMPHNAWAFGSASPDKLKYAIDPKWFGEKPRTYWFNARGERIAYSGTLTPEKIKSLQQRTAK